MKLADRIEQAEGPSRELDAEIAQFFGLRVVDHGHPIGRCCYENGISVPLPYFTSRTEATAKFVPEGHGYAVGNGVPDEGPWAWCSLPGEVNVIHASTPALALCAAAIRAQEAGE
jgi:hypothetical protein